MLYSIYEAAIVKSLLNNSQMWTEISEATVNKLEGLQNVFLKVILDSPSTTPNCAGVWDTAMTGMRFRIMKRKLRFINFIKKCDDSFLAKQIYQEQLKHNWPGLTQEAREMCVLLDLPDITKVAVSSACNYKKGLEYPKKGLKKDSIFG